MRKILIHQSFLIFLFASILLYLGTSYLIPFFHEKTGLEIVICWFIVAGIGVFTPLLVIAYFIMKNERAFLQLNWWNNRLRFRTLTFGDWIWGVGGIVVIGLLSFLIMEGMEKLIGPFDSQPPFMSFDPLDSGRYYILLLWFPYWILNIMGEEILWRGVLLPRMEVTHRKYAWIINGTFWGMFHIAFGWQLLVTLIPILYIQSYIVQKRKNTWLGVLIHGAVNGPAFVAISFGLI